MEWLLFGLVDPVLFLLLQYPAQNVRALIGENPLF